MLAFGLIALGVVVAVFLLALARRLLRRRRMVACACAGGTSLLLLVAVAGVALVAFNFQSFHRLTREQPAAEVQFARTAAEEFTAQVTYPEGRTEQVALRGDEWQVEARVLKWRAWANLVGFDSAYRLERISGRYTDIDRERSAARTVHALYPPERIDVVRLLHQWQRYVPWVDAYYGSAVYLPMRDGARFQVVVSPSGLLARPLNAAARDAVGGWKMP